MYRASHKKSGAALISVGALLAICAVIAGALMFSGTFKLSASHAAGNNAFISQFHHVNTVASTVPGNGDVNPYGTAVVPNSMGRLVRGDVLVSNFNDKANVQGTGTTIVQISPNGKASLFAWIPAKGLKWSCPGGVGLTTGLVVLQRGWVVVGSLPTNAKGVPQAGCLIVLNSNGKVVGTIAGKLINGPWDMAASDHGNWAALFVSNVLNGTVAAKGKAVNKQTIVRINLNVPFQGLPRITSATVIGSGFSARTDAAALVIGPTGVALANNGTLYVADTLNNRISAIPNALMRTNSANAGLDVTSNGALNAPLGLTIAPNGDILTVNANDGFLVETTPRGAQISKVLLDKTVTNGSPAGAGCLFGLAVRSQNGGVYFVDDCSNTLNLFH
jgi:hypothetical protein